MGEEDQEEDKQQQQQQQQQTKNDDNDDNNIRTIDPNAVLCPYELSGVCLDESCPYQHLSTYEVRLKEIKKNNYDDDSLLLSSSFLYKKKKIPCLFNLKLTGSNVSTSSNKKKMPKKRR